MLAVTLRNDRMSLKQFTDDLHNKTLTPALKHASFQNFIAYFDTLKVAALGTTKIKDYNAVKADLEAYVNQTRQQNIFKRFWNWLLIAIGQKKKSGRRIVNWRPETSVDATIINL
jgi:hypothetical protein